MRVEEILIWYIYLKVQYNKMLDFHVYFNCEAGLGAL